MPRHELERAHVVQPVGELDHDDAPVGAHGEQHVAVVELSPLLGRQRRHVLIQLGHLGVALDDVRNAASAGASTETSHELRDDTPRKVLKLPVAGQPVKSLSSTQHNGSYFTASRKMSSATLLYYKIARIS
eukprot:6196620-Pleurochrysis_carterae.AAC.1